MRDFRLVRGWAAVNKGSARVCESVFPTYRPWRADAERGTEGAPNIQIRGGALEGEACLPPHQEALEER